LNKKIFPYAKQFLLRCLDTTAEICNPYTPIVINCSVANPLVQKYPVWSNVFAPISQEEEMEAEGDAPSNKDCKKEGEEKDGEVPMIIFKSPYNA